MGVNCLRAAFFFFLTFALLPLSMVKPVTAAQLGVDFIVSGQYEKWDDAESDHGIGLRTHSSFYWGEGFTRLGVAVQYEIPNSDTREILIGPGIRFGRSWFLELNPSYLYRNLSGSIEKGVGGVAQFGKSIPLSRLFEARISVPIVFKRVTSGITDKLIVDYIPYIGLSLNL